MQTAGGRELVIDCLCHDGCALWKQELASVSAHKKDLARVREWLEVALVAGGQALVGELADAAAEVQRPTDPAVADLVVEWAQKYGDSDRLQNHWWPPVIVLGSKSEIKIAALTEALEILGFRAEIISVDVESGVPPQPQNEETRQGAMNRSSNAMAAYPGAAVYVAIENGIFQQPDGTWVDKAVVCLTTSAGNHYTYVVTFSDGVVFDTQYVEEARRRGFDKYTVGQVMQELGIVKDHRDPHADLSAKPRKDFLKEALVSVLPEFAEQLKADQRHAPAAETRGRTLSLRV